VPAVGAGAAVVALVGLVGGAVVGTAGDFIELAAGPVQAARSSAAAATRGAARRVVMPGLSDGDL
jgi:hypothetical protein